VRAVRLVDAHRLEPVDLPDPEPSEGEVVVQVNSCGVCGSDLSSYKVGLFTDSVPGHEISGTVAAVGPGAGRWRVGERTVVDPKLPCGVCDECAAGTPWRCAFALTAGLGFARNGGFAEQVLAPAHLLHRIPEDLPLEAACLVEPLSVALHGVVRAGEVSGPAVVVGLGPIGLFTVAALRSRGVEDVVGVDPVADRRRLASVLGAAQTVADIAEVRSLIAPAQAVFECSGVPTLLHRAADLVAPGGVLVMLGVPFGEATVLPLMWVTREIAILGSIASSEADFRDAISMLSADPGLSAVVTRRAGLSEVPALFEELIAPSSGAKAVVDPARL